MCMCVYACISIIWNFYPLRKNFAGTNIFSDTRFVENFPFIFFFPSLFSPIIYYHFAERDKLLRRDRIDVSRIVEQIVANGGISFGSDERFSIEWMVSSVDGYTEAAARRNGKVMGNRLWRSLEDFGPARPDNAVGRVASPRLENPLAKFLLRALFLVRHEFWPKLLALLRGQRRAADRSFDFRNRGIGRSFPIKNLEHFRARNLSMIDNHSFAIVLSLIVIILLKIILK